MARLRQGERHVDAAEHLAGAGVGDGDHVGRPGVVGQERGNASRRHFPKFAVGRVHEEWLTGEVGTQRLDLMPRQAFPGADGELPQPLVQRQLKAGGCADDAGGVRGAAEGAGDQTPVRRVVDPAGEEGAYAGSLGEAQLSQRRVHAALQAAIAVEVGLAVANEPDQAAAMASMRSMTPPLRR